MEQVDGVMYETGKQENLPSSKDAPLKTPPVKSPVSTPVKLSGNKLVGQLDIEVYWIEVQKKQENLPVFPVLPPIRTMPG